MLRCKHADDRSAPDDDEETTVPSDQPTPQPPECTICGATYSNLIEHMRTAH